MSVHCSAFVTVRSY